MIAQEVLIAFTADVTYAYHIGLNRLPILAAGFSAGVTRIGY
jgi:hypothetical protein